MAAREKAGSGRKNLLTVCLLIAIVLMFIFAVFGNRGVLRILQAEEQKNNLELQLTELNRQQTELRACCVATGVGNQVGATDAVPETLG